MGMIETHLTIDQQAAIHEALSDPARLHLLALMDGTRNCQEIEDALAACYKRFSQPTIAYHMRILRKAGLIEMSTSRHYYAHRYYIRRQETLDMLSEAMKEVGYEQSLTQ